MCKKQTLIIQRSSANEEIRSAIYNYGNSSIDFLSNATGFPSSRIRRFLCDKEDGVFTFSELEKLVLVSGVPVTKVVTYMDIGYLPGYPFDKKTD